jgi:hypothetical protein
MRTLGYRDFRPEAAQAQRVQDDWRVRLDSAAQSFLAPDPDQALAVARTINFLGNGFEDPSNMCGPLAGAILQEAQLLPAGYSPLNDLKIFWLAGGIREGGPPWDYFPPERYTLYTFDERIDVFDFSTWPLTPGDLVYTYAGEGLYGWDLEGEYEHIFVVTSLDEEGRAYSVTNQQLPDLSYVIREVLLYDPADPTVGAFRTTWVEDPYVVGRTGLGGFDVLRLNGLTQQAGSTYTYTVEPGDTTLSIAREFHSSPEVIAHQNGLEAFAVLQVGQELEIPILAP